MNNYYTVTGAPATGSAGSSATMRSEFDLIAAAFDKLPTLTGNANQIPHINAGATAFTTTSGFTMSGNVLTVPGGLNVSAGSSNLAGPVTLGVGAGNAITVNGNTITWNAPVHSGNHTFTGNIAFNGTTLMRAASTFNAAVGLNAALTGNAAADMNINSGKFTVQASSGNAGIGGNLTVSGNQMSLSSIPCFLAQQSTNIDNVTGGGTTYNVSFDTEVFDQDNNFAGNIFTAPATGKYELAARVGVNNVTTLMNAVTLAIVTTGKTYSSGVRRFTLGSQGRLSEQLSVPAALMNAGETALVRLIISGDTDTADIDGAATAFTYFSGRRVA